MVEVLREDGAYISLITEPTIKSQKVTIVVFKELLSSLSECLVVGHAPVKVLNLLVLLLEQFQGEPVVSDDTLECLEVSELGEE